MSPALNGSTALQRFKCNNTVQISSGIMFDFYPGLPQLSGYFTSCHQSRNDHNATFVRYDFLTPLFPFSPPPVSSALLFNCPCPPTHKVLSPITHLILIRSVSHIFSCLSHFWLHDFPFPHPPVPLSSLWLFLTRLILNWYERYHGDWKGIFPITYVQLLEGELCTSEWWVYWK